jgi:hypothetical protein
MALGSPNTPGQVKNQIQANPKTRQQVIKGLNAKHPGEMQSAVQKGSSSSSKGK